MLISLTGMQKKMKSGRERRKTEKKNQQKGKYSYIDKIFKVQSPSDKYYFVVLLWVYMISVKFCTLKKDTYIKRRHNHEYTFKCN